MFKTVKNPNPGVNNKFAWLSDWKWADINGDEWSKKLAALKWL